MTKLVTRRAQFERASEIATVLFASGFGWLVGAVGLGSCVSLRCRLHCALGFEQCPHHVAMDAPLPERMRAVLEQLGPTFVKAGQMLALRPDYVPLEYAEALSSLHDAVAPFPGEQAMRLVEQELGKPIAQLYAEFEREPFAAASLSQVHRARLPDGRAVAVKVQRPGIGEQVERDLALLASLAGRLERRRAETLGFRPSAAVAELAEYTRRELDFRREAQTATRVRELFAADEHVVIPEVDWERTSARVLTMELLVGERPAPAERLRERGLDPDALLRTGAQAMLRQIFVYGLFHADPHPGNLLLQPGNKIAFLDFGMFGKLDRRARRRMGFLFWALVEDDFEAVGEQLLRISTRRPGADPGAFRAAVADTVEEWFGARSNDYSIARLLLRELALGAGYGIVFPRELMLLARALVNLEASAAVVDPALSLAELARPFLPELRRALLLDPRALEEAWHANRFEYLELALELPDLLAELASRLGSPNQSTADRVPCAVRLPAWLPILGALAAGAAVASGLRRSGSRRQDLRRLRRRGP